MAEKSNGFDWNSIANAGLSALTGGFGGAIGNAIGSLFGSSEDSMWTQHKMNKDMAMLQQGYNKDNMYLQRQLQEQAMHQQQKYNFELMDVQDELNFWNWKKQFDIANQYNTPEQQRQRYEQAGFNPYNLASGGAVGSGSGGSATGTGVAMPSTPGASGGLPSASALGASAYQDVPYAFNAISDFVKDLVLTKMNNKTSKDINDATNATNLGIAEGNQTVSTENNKRDNSTKLKTSPFTNPKFESIYQRYYGALADQEENKAFVSSSTLNAQVAQVNASALEMQETARMRALQNNQIIVETALLNKQLAWYDASMRSELAVNCANIAMMRAQGLLSEKTAQMYVSQKLYIDAMKSGQNISNHIADKTAEFIIKNQEIEHESMVNYGNKEGKWNNRLNVVNSLTGSLKNVGSMVR